MRSSVALLAEGVDRNHVTLSGQNGPTLVALLAEGVDRNHIAYYYSYNKL